MARYRLEKELHPRPSDPRPFDQSAGVLSVRDFERRRASSRYDVTGVYVLHNAARDKYYVGQSKTMMSRIHAHFSGHGCRDVFMDYRSGDAFFVQMITLEKSGYPGLNVLEHDLIRYYQAVEYGYNELRGNEVHSKGYDAYYRPSLLRDIVHPYARRSPRARPVASVAERPKSSPDGRRASRLMGLEHRTDEMLAAGVAVDPVLVTVSGMRYHRDAGCRYLMNKVHTVSDGGSMYRVDSGLLREAGYLPCRRCCGKEDA